MTRRHHALQFVLSIVLLNACAETVRVDPSAMPWEVATLNGSCESALQIRSNELLTHPNSGYTVVRVMTCPDRLNATREVVRLLQVKDTKGTLYWFEDAELKR